jgi:hypothetical protein
MANPHTYRRVKEANFWLEILASYIGFGVAVFFGMWLERWIQTGNWHNFWLFLFVGSIISDITLYRVGYHLGWWMMEHLTQHNPK